ncbi:prepilin-type N-terminal cleavage/methylation domain-containing protein [Anaerobacillus sp. MEB173]|uniref:prepilin-type N-terminal cleavage/methylation domain-containing protein n=1 Tax=Anaerobacillus sp. MEB173 TaxID=3383345 RepID=UPI003F903F19
MRNCNGFTLIEVIASLSIVTVLMASCLPLFITVNNERVAIRENFYAFDLLYVSIQDWLIEERVHLYTQQVERNGTLYRITVQSEEMNNAFICIKWLGSNDRQYERCEYAKK